MKNILLVCAFSACGLLSCSEKKTSEERTVEQTLPQTEMKVKEDGLVIMKQAKEDTLKGSPKAYTIGKVGDAEIKITYHSPAVRGRIVWGGLVPYDKVWVTGAHMATTFEINKNVEVDGKKIPAGRYAIFTIPGKKAWTFILNKNWQQHLVDEYDAKHDILRVLVEPETEESHQERLRYSIEEDGDSESEIVFYWEKIELSIPIKIK